MNNGLNDNFVLPGLKNINLYNLKQYNFFCGVPRSNIDWNLIKYYIIHSNYS